MRQLSRREKEREFKKGLIAEAAYKLFTENSYETVTVEDIAREAEFGKGTVYQYFESKEEILIYVVLMRMEQFMDDAEQLELEASDVVTVLKAYIRLQFNFYYSWNHLFLSWLRLHIQPEFRERWLSEIKQLNERKMSLLITILSRGQEMGQVRAGDSKHLAWTLDNLLKGYSIGMMEKSHIGVMGDTDEFEQRIQLLYQVLLQGICSGEER